MSSETYERRLSIIIPAAGAGRRMKSYGPKPLIEVSPWETVLSRQIRVLRSAFPTAEIILVIGYEAERVLRALPAACGSYYRTEHFKVVENELFADSNVLRSIGMALRVASHPRVLLVYGDLVFNHAAVSWAGARGASGVLVDTHERMGEEEIGVNVVHGRVTNFSYGLITKWGQMAYLVDRELDLFRQAAWDPNRRRHFGFEGLNAVIDGGGRLRAIEPKDMILAEIDTSKDIEIARRIVAEEGRS